jgi:magnesium transporter
MMEQKDRALSEMVADLARSASTEELHDLLQDQRPEDITDLIEHLDAETRDVVFAALDQPMAADVLPELEDKVREDVLEGLELDEVSRLVEEMDPADAADVVADLSNADASAVLDRLPPHDAREVRALLDYPEESVGGVMSTLFVAVRADGTVGDAVETIRERSVELGDFYYVYSVERQGRLVGVLSLKDLLLSPRSRPISELMHRDVISIAVDADREEAATLATRYDLFALPVVDADYRLVGQVTLDEVMEIIEEETSEDMYRMVGLSEDESVFSSFAFSVRKRLPWLYINLATAILAAWVISRFEGTIAKLAVLAALQSIVAGQGGNAGTQTLTIIVRGLALGELDLRNTWRALLKEFALGAINGAAVGAGIGALVGIWYGNPWLGLVIAAAMLLNMIAAGVAGALVPLLLRWLRIDPALASAVIVTTVTDCCGFFFFLGLATLMMSHLR